MWVLINEDLTHLGGPMGTEYTTTRWRKCYNDIDAAKAAAQEDYEPNHFGPLRWIKDGDQGAIRTNDLGYVMYYIKPVKTED